MRENYSFLSFLFGVISIISGVLSYVFSGTYGMGKLFVIIQLIPILSLPGLLFAHLGLKSEKISLAKIGRLLCILGFIIWLGSLLIL